MTSQDGLAQLRQMHERGEITDEQYDALRRHVLWGTPLPDLEDVPSPRSGADPVGGYVPGAATVGPDRSRYAGPAGRPVGPSEATGPAPQRYASRRERREAEEARAHYPAPPAHHPAQDYPPPADQPRGFPPRDYPLPDYPPPADRPPSDPPPRGFQPPDYPPPAESRARCRRSVAWRRRAGIVAARRHQRRRRREARRRPSGRRAGGTVAWSRQRRRTSSPPAAAAGPPGANRNRTAPVGAPARRPAGSPRRPGSGARGGDPWSPCSPAWSLALALAAGGVYWFELRRRASRRRRTPGRPAAPSATGSRRSTPATPR